MGQDKVHGMIVFVLLVTVGVVGRWAQPTWNVTPLAALAAFAGYYYLRTSIAFLVPAIALIASNMLLPAYGDWLVFLSVLAMVLLPVILGRVARRASGMQRALVVAICGFGPATVFYGVTNLFVWLSTGLYEQSLPGLLACYTAAIPFYRAMLLGDLLYVGLFVLVAWGQYAMDAAKWPRCHISAIVVCSPKADPDVMRV